MFIILLFAYWLIFFGHILFEPFKIASSEILEYDFPIMRLAGECWKKGRLPYDDYYYDDFIGVRPILLYPVNILVSLRMASTSLDRAFCYLVYNLLVHLLLCSVFAYFMFGQGWIGLFGALAWTYQAYHVQQSITRTQGFCWLTATVFFLLLHHPVLAGISFGLMVLCANPPYTIYLFYGILGYFIAKSVF